MTKTEKIKLRKRLPDMAKRCGLGIITDPMTGNFLITEKGKVVVMIEKLGHVAQWLDGYWMGMPIKGEPTPTPVQECTDKKEEAGEGGATKKIFEEIQVDFILCSSLKQHQIRWLINTVERLRK